MSTMSLSTFDLLAAHVTSAMIGIAVSVILFTIFAASDRLKQRLSESSARNFLVWMMIYAFALPAIILAIVPIPHLFIRLMFPESAFITLLLSIVASSISFFRWQCFGKVEFR